jgi:HlyD family secretion protein
MPEQQIFRKSSLERLSTPEQLDYLMQVTTPKGWYALWTLCGLLLIALGWSVVGSLPTVISGPALIMPPRGVDDVYAPASGILRELLVKEGDQVKIGDVVARLEQKELAEKGTFSKTEVGLKIAAARDRISSLEKKSQSKREALAMGLIAPGELDSANEALASARVELKSLQNQLELGGMDLRRAQDIRASTNGRVVELDVTPGTLVNRGDTIFTFVDDSAGINAVAFIPDVGNQAKPGMPARISPLSIKAEEFGSMFAKVYQVTELPARRNLLLDIVHNDVLISQFTAKGSPYVVWMNLEKDPKTFSGYRWSSAGGPHERIEAGMVCQARIVVRTQRPITLVIPALKKFLGM